ncbi:MAG: 2-hydroxyacyl-CoA dehydratase [Oscillospiraceae bacterium]|nr:2-hydroxyacyl-CoA dehydratase [Oscillospiraceae bacterium]
MKRIGLDVGSTTVKCVVLDEKQNIVWSAYRRHMSQISLKTAELIAQVSGAFRGEIMSLSVTGSAGMGMASDLDIPFVQEVYATRAAVNSLCPGTDTVIELGGEDAKILFLTDGLEVRMNGSCAGGTGAFIDQMATLMNITPTELNDLAARAEKTYTIASRCGVFAKSDIQPLINQGARKPDIAASILYAVVNQTIGGLAQGRPIAGRVLYLGGPLTFFSQLRAAFDKTLGLEGLCPENSLYFAALGSALCGQKSGFDLERLQARIKDYASSEGYVSAPPLFKSEDDYNAFSMRHYHDSDSLGYTEDPAAPMLLGIDAGSTTVKAVVCDEAGRIFDTMYKPNSGNPVPMIRDYLTGLYSRYPELNIVSSAVTGYGEDIIRNAFRVDNGIVETVAHFTAAKKFRPDVDFIIDIGGQDIKCFKIRNNAIDNIFLNEACSSGCGSFLQTFAGALGYDIKDFARLGFFAKKPVDLGSRCTVFMNSSVKQAQKDGATVDCISAGLSISVVKNALYKVIRCASAAELGDHIVVQGGTFMNDAVLRAFELEVGKDVIRPRLAGMMGAYGAALYAGEHRPDSGKSSVLTPEELGQFTHSVRTVNCGGCGNNCQLTVNTFSGGRRFIAGNRCDKPVRTARAREEYNMYAFKTQLLEAYRKNERHEGRRSVGIPMCLNMYELLPFWHRLFTELGFDVIVSPPSDRKLFISGQHTIPSDTVCFPAKLAHGHIEHLLRENVDAIFYPCMSYNVDEGRGDNHFNCPVVAYYPEVIRCNVGELKGRRFIYDFFGLHNPDYFPKRFLEMLNREFGGFTLKEVRRASRLAYEEYNGHMAKIREKAREYMDLAKEKGLPVIVLVGRPYHVDPEVNHGIDKLICSLGCVLVTEDGVNLNTPRFRTGVLNQWTYHARLYNAAKYVAQTEDDVNLVQLVSFGCGVDAVTTDETRSIVESGGKIYTQIKIDEVTNTGAAKIRLRSLMAALGK